MMPVLRQMFACFFTLVGGSQVFSYMPELTAHFKAIPGRTSCLVASISSVVLSLVALRKIKVCKIKKDSLRLCVWY